MRTAYFWMQTGVRKEHTHVHLWDNMRSLLIKLDMHTHELIMSFVCQEEITTEDSGQIGWVSGIFLFTGGLCFCCMCFNGAVDNNKCFCSTSLVALYAGFLCVYMHCYTYLGPFTPTCIKLHPCLQKQNTRTHTHHIDMEVEQKKWCLGLLGWIIFNLSLGKVQLAFCNNGDHDFTNTNNIHREIPQICINQHTFALFDPPYFFGAEMSIDLPAIHLWHRGSLCTQGCQVAS